LTLSSGHIVSQKNNRSLSKFARTRYRLKIEDLLKKSSSKSFNKDKFKPISAEQKLKIKEEVRREVFQFRTKAIIKTSIIILVCFILFILLFKLLSR